MAKRRQGARRVRKLSMTRFSLPRIPIPRLALNFWGVVLCALMGLFGSAAVIASQHLLGDFEVSRIEVEGDLLHLRPGQVKGRLEDLLLNQRSASDLKDIRSLLLIQPWISEARVRRTWPDGLQIEIIEQRPQARWNQTQFLGMQGDLFEPIKQPMVALPRLFGPKGSENLVFERHQAWASELANLGLELQETRLDPDLGWSLITASGLQIDLGRLELDLRMKRFATAWRKRISTTPDVAKVDLRYRHGLALTLEAQNNG